MIKLIQLAHEEAHTKKDSGMHMNQPPPVMLLREARRDFKDQVQGLLLYTFLMNLIFLITHMEAVVRQQ